MREFKRVNVAPKEYNANIYSQSHDNQTISCQDSNEIIFSNS